jgi:hypothetical protein
MGVISGKRFDDAGPEEEQHVEHKPDVCIALTFFGDAFTVQFG